MEGVAKVQLGHPWGDGDSCYMELSRSGGAIGTVQLTARPLGDVLLFSSVMQLQDWREQIEVRVAPDTLLPLSTDFQLHASPSGDAYTYRALYTDGRLEVDADRPDGPVRVEMKLPDPPYYENEQFLWLLRALPLAQGWNADLQLVVSRGSVRIRVLVEVTGRQLVTTPAGDLDAWVVSLQDLEQTAWVEVAYPHRVARYDNLRAATVSLLTGYASLG